MSNATEPKPLADYFHAKAGGLCIAGAAGLARIFVEPVADRPGFVQVVSNEAFNGATPSHTVIDYGKRTARSVKTGRPIRYPKNSLVGTLYNVGRYREEVK